MILGILQALFSLGFNILSFLLSVTVALVVGFSMAAKGRNGFLWGIAAFFFPWIILVTFMIPAKTPKLHSRIRNHPAFAGKNPVVASIMALSAMVAKSDGVVSKEEIALVRRFVQQQFRISSQELNTYADAFNYGKDNPKDYEYFTDLLSHYRRYNIVMAVSYLFVGMTLEDGHLADREDSILRKILTGLGLHEYEYQSIKRHYSGQTGAYNTYGSFGSGFGGFGQEYYRQASSGTYQQSADGRVDLTKKYSDVLGVAEEADLATIKKAYRKLAKEHHPDRMAQDGMPEGYAAYAHKKISEINEAYEWLKEAKSQTA